MTMFITHPSIRIKGTETNFNPVQCVDISCSNKNSHMHCPFCQKTEFYADPIILRAHYRVKHVDKGIDFAGLKVLRCCNLCDIVGAIKGEKKFKGAHWHCYKCKNGFNRRDEAIKHYKTHFRNPQTTFQIHIAQEVNNPVQLCENQDEVQNFEHDEINSSSTIHPVLTETIKNAANNSSNNENDSYLANGPSNLNDCDPIHSSVGANETVGSANDAHQVIYEDLNHFTQNNGEIEKIRIDQKNYKEWRMKEEVYIEKEQQLLGEIERLKAQIERQADEITTLKKREIQLMEHVQLSSNCNLQELMNNLQNQHLELLQQQIFQVKRAAILSNDENGVSDLKQSILPEPVVTTNCLASNSLRDETMIALVMDQSCNDLHINRPVAITQLNSSVPTMAEQFPTNEAHITPDIHNSPSDSLVIIDWNDEMKKRVAEVEDSIMKDNKRKK